MLITALFLIVAAAWFFASGRLLLAFFPPGWPGWAPGMGTRELGATVGASWLLGATALWAQSSVVNVLLVGAEPARAEDILAVHTQVYLGLHVVLLIAARLRAPAKLRPRHERATRARFDFSPVFAVHAVLLAAIPALYALDGLREELGASTEIASTQAAMFFAGAVPEHLVPLGIAFVLVGALVRLGVARLAAWLVGSGWLLAGLLTDPDLLREPVTLARSAPGPRELQTFLLACVLGLVWARTADRRARGIALLLLATLPLAANFGVTVTALIGLVILRFAVPSGGSMRWPWVLWFACALTPIVHYYVLLRDVLPAEELTFGVHASHFTIADFEHWRWWLTPPAAVLLWCWVRSRTPSDADDRRLVRIAGWLVALAPALLVMQVALRDAVGFGLEGLPYEWDVERLVTLRYFVLGWTPALLLLVLANFAPRVAHGSATDEPST